MVRRIKTKSNSINDEVMQLFTNYKYQKVKAGVSVTGMNTNDPSRAFNIVKPEMNPWSPRNDKFEINAVETK